MKTLSYAKSSKVSKEKLIEILNNSLSDETCPLSWEDAVIVRLRTDD